MRPASLRQRLVDLNLALHVGPPVLVFLRRPIFLPNKISCKDMKPTPRLFESRPSVTVSDLIEGTFFFVNSINV